MTNPGEQPKLIIDSDWKAQAQAEKERLAQQEQAKAAQQGEVDEHGMPPRYFARWWGCSRRCADVHGAIPDEQGRRWCSTWRAHSIDLLATLSEKTKGNHQGRGRGTVGGSRAHVRN